MHRFFIAPQQMNGSAVFLSPEQAHQVARVLRLHPGDRVCVLDGTGMEHVVELSSVAPSGVRGCVVETRPCPGEPSARVCLGLGLLKGEKMDWAIQKATEAGAAEIVPLACARSVVRLESGQAAGRAERWGRIAQEAAEQCRRGQVPHVRPPATLAQLLARRGEFRQALMAYEGNAEPLACGLQRGAGPGGGWLLLVGPEGGFAPEEVARAQAAGAVPVSLGPRILRAETAAVVGTALLLHELERVALP